MRWFSELTTRSKRFIYLCEWKWEPMCEFEWFQARHSVNRCRKTEEIWISFLLMWKNVYFLKKNVLFWFQCHWGSGFNCHKSVKPGHQEWILSVSHLLEGTCCCWSLLHLEIDFGFMSMGNFVTSDSVLCLF